MDEIEIQAPVKFTTKKVDLPISKSIMNRLLIIRFLGGQEDFKLPKSPPRDVKLLHKALLSKSKELNFEDAGTAFRFATAYCCTVEGEKTLTGTPRMLKRPIGPLVKALRQWGADIEYLGEEGFPPLKIKGKKLEGGKVKVAADISSQFISALLMIAPLCESRSEIILDGNPVSRPYIHMTLQLMRQHGISIRQSNLTYSISPAAYKERIIEPGMDWSGASFFYALCALGTGVELSLKGLQTDGIQGDQMAMKIFEPLGVKTIKEKGGLKISSEASKLELPEEIDFIDCPDLFMPVAVTCAGLGVDMKFKGLHNLHLKESNRLEAMVYNLAQIKCQLKVDGSTATLKTGKLPKKATFKCFDDHRLAMSLAMLSVRIPKVHLDQKEVVEKSFPNFWKQMEKLGFVLA